jgi:dolichol-phosphate mannosyltransferase
MRNNPFTESSRTPSEARVRYRAVQRLSDWSGSTVLQPGEALLVPTFELAEALIAGGADSARLAITWRPPDGTRCRYEELAPDKALVPSVPYTFEHPVLIVLPTYNERQNLEAMIGMITRYIAADILVVDDNSPDGTGALADELSHRSPAVHVLHRPEKEGLGPAYLAGFRWALARGYERIMGMDCDFSHAPWDLPRLLHQSRTADVVIGSRYIPGGGTQNWNIRRRLISRLANAYVGLCLGREIRDWTGGFRCYRRDVLAAIDLTKVRAKGYIFQVELAWRAKRQGARIAEMPIRFTDRLYGHSKLGWPSICEAVRAVPLMWFR